MTGLPSITSLWGRGLPPITSVSVFRFWSLFSPILRTPVMTFHIASFVQFEVSGLLPALRPIRGVWVYLRVLPPVVPHWSGRTLPRVCLHEVFRCVFGNQLPNFRNKPDLGLRFWHSANVFYFGCSVLAIPLRGFGFKLSTVPTTL